MTKGIDVSKWQGRIDWPKVEKLTDIEFAILKAGGSDNGFYIDPYFEDNYRGAKSVGIGVGAYYFVGPKCQSAADGKADAKRFLNIIAGKKFEYPVCLDFEAPPAWSKTGNTDASIAFCKEMELHGYYVSIYASDISGFADRLDLARLSAYDKWVACYGRKPTNVQIYGMWQYSSTGRVAGINGNVDMDEAYYDFPDIMKGHHLNGY